MKENKIEIAVPNDVGIILTMIREHAEWEGYSDEVEANEEILTESLFGNESIAKVLIAHIEDKPVGYMVYFPKFASYTGRNEIYLQDIYLRKEARGSGLGLAFMVKLAKVALESKATRIEWFVDENNTPALSFYEKLGGNVNDAIKVVRLKGVNLTSLANLEE